MTVVFANTECVEDKMAYEQRNVHMMFNFMYTDYLPFHMNVARKLLTWWQGKS